MINKILALALRSLRTDSRDIRSHLFRLALGLVVLSTIVTLQLNNRQSSTPGLDFFYWICQYNYWFVTLAAPTVFATTITEEKEERTLALLKMAGVNGSAVLLGKWLPKLLFAFLLVAIQFPFSQLAVTMGGVQVNQISCMYLTLFAHLFLVGNFAILMSVARPTSGSAAFGTTVFLVLLHLLSWTLNRTAMSLSLPAFLQTPLEQGTTLFVNNLAWWQMSSITGSGYVADWLFWSQVTSNFVIGGLFLLLAWIVYEPCTRNEVEPQESIWMRQLRLATSRRHQRVWDSAILWKEFYYLIGGPLSLIVRAAVYFGAAFLTMLIVNDWQIGTLRVNELGNCMMIMSLLFLWIEAVIIGARMYRNEITAQTWGTLCMIPRPFAQLTYSKLAVALIVLVPGICCLVAGILLSPDNFGDAMRNAYRKEVWLLIYFFVFQPLLAIHVAVWASVALKWANWAGAMFVGVFAIFLFNFPFMTVVTQVYRGPDECAPLMAMMILIDIAVIAFLHVLIGKRLFALQAE